MNSGPVENNIPVHLDNLRVGERYTFYHVNAPNVGIRGTLLHKFPAHHNLEARINFRPDVGGQQSIPLPRISRITQSGIGPNEDTGRLINALVGGRKKRKKRKSRKSRKSKRRRRKTKRKRRTKRRRKTRRR
jgi:hypothetical protein|tara:strand:- start:4188 stop:4583 length:396 start_codon:yes stop_codon:yes gene_type:complete